MGKWLWIIVVVLLTLPGCGSDDTPTRPNTFTPLTSIVITSTVVSLPAGVSTQLIATGNFSGLFSRDISSEVTWSSAQPGVADFPSGFPPGRVKALVAGPATITATSEGISSDGFNLTVNNAVITALTLAPSSPSLPLGLTQAFTAQGTFSDGIMRDLTKDVVWASSDATVATIGDDFASKGMASALKMGTTEISARFDTFTPASTLLTVTAPILLAIEVTPASPSLLSLSTQAFSATGIFSNGMSRDITTDAGLTWASASPEVATVATANIINALTPGLSAINATLGTVSGTSNLTVTGGSLQSIALTLAQAVNGVLINGTSSRVTARGNFDNGTSRDITGVVALSVDSTASSNVRITSVSGNLAWVEALAVTATPAKISATYGTLPVKEISLTVTAPILNEPGLSIPEQALTLASGTSGRLSLLGAFSSGSQDLTPTADWSSNSAIATVGNVGLEKGRVHAVAAGTTVITATYGTPQQSATRTVTVVARTLQSLTISAVTTPASIVAGTEKEFKVTARYTDGFEQDVTADATWSIDNANVAQFSDQLSDPGLVVAVDAGTATLTVKFGGREDTETLTVSL